MSKWDQQFAPVIALGREVRDGQRQLGNAVIDVVEKGGNLIGEASTGTGKSFATLIPLINAVKKAKSEKKTYRAVVSTETLILQGQIFTKDLPFLYGIYGGFTYHKLMGRSNYLCLNAADNNKIGLARLSTTVEKLKARKDNLGAGEKQDVERVLGRELDDTEWEKITGSSTFCADNSCTPESCFSSLARKHAKTADIVIVNHSILAIDLEMKLNGTSEEGILGDFEALVVDEAHQLEPTLVKQWTKELTTWELASLSGSIAGGIEIAQGAIANSSMGRLTQGGLDDLEDMFKNIQNFYSLLVAKQGDKWRGSSSALSMKFLSSGDDPRLISAMVEYEEQNPARLAHAEQVLEAAIEYLQKAAIKAKDINLRNRRKVSKGFRCAKDLLDIVKIVSQALETRNGIINQYGIYGAIVDGWEKRDGTQGMTLRLVPLDVSPKAQYLWHNKTNVFVSATLTDLTDMTFKYAKECVGFPAAKEIRVSSPFDMPEQQLVYMTPATGTKVTEVNGAQFDFKEMVDLINASRGRSLVLFTSRQELDWASNELLQLRNMGYFNYPILIQERDSNKEKLMAEFKSVTDSVLMATKSFFVGIDVPGEALSSVIMAKWTNPQYSVECRQRVEHWGAKGFKRWYEREALTTFQQASGRLIRSSGCKGVVGVLDFRISDTTSNVFKTAKLGVTALGSPTTINMDDVKAFLA